MNQGRTHFALYQMEGCVDEWGGNAYVEFSGNVLQVSVCHLKVHVHGA